MTKLRSRRSAATRVEVVTEGILLRRLQADPTLPGVGLVILDEFHERSVQVLVPCPLIASQALASTACAFIRVEFSLLSRHVVESEVPVPRPVPCRLIASASEWPQPALSFQWNFH